MAKLAEKFWNKNNRNFNYLQFCCSTQIRNLVLNWARTHPFSVNWNSWTLCRLPTFILICHTLQIKHTGYHYNCNGYHDKNESGVLTLSKYSVTHSFFSTSSQPGMHAFMKPKATALTQLENSEFISKCTVEYFPVFEMTHTNKRLFLLVQTIVR